MTRDAARHDDARPLSACPRCGCGELFIRKDFPQKLGIAIVVIAGVTFLVLAASRQRFYLGVLVLLAAVAVDLVLYAIVPKMTVCYRCRSEFRNVPLNPAHGGYELAVGEKYRKR
ncbi:MAG TPA: hypothetical protein VGR35_15435 [Tepidisphaeraceae bacterium]|nr:hypothetical protein [Tepidisphaeraceae bacterium]